MSGGGASVVIKYPWKDWSVLWGDGLKNFQLDIVGFLAVLGEGSVTANAQVAALSPLFYLPRLIPAPQALLWPSRPVELDPTKATVTGVESGIVKEHVHHVANVLLGGEMEKWTVRCVEVNKAPDRPRPRTLKEQIFGVKQDHSRDPIRDPEKEHERRQPPIGPPVVRAKANGPLAWVTLASCLLSIIMFVLSIFFGDGYSIISTILLSLLSTLIGVVNKSSLSLPQRPKNSKDNAMKHVVIRYPNGSFLVVKCDENVARELFFAPEEIEYRLKSPAVYRLISLVGTILLMGGVIFLANARLQLQAAWGGAYIISNILHWVAAAIPSRHHWDLSCYEVREQGIMHGPKADNFTDALWKTIVFTKSTTWIKKGNAAPRTKVWKKWAEEALARAKDQGSHFGPLTQANKHWKEQEGEQSNEQDYRIWNVPDGFNAKETWDAINEGFLTQTDPVGTKDVESSAEHSDA